MKKERIIEVRDLTKIYNLYDNSSDRFKEAVHPFRKVYHRDFYALKGVSFDLYRGESFAVIGRNGSGKSTLLKIITGVLTPTCGSVKVNGRVASLLELGAGFNPEYTGMENIYLSGTLAGFSHKEMNEKLDDILSFADIGDFVNQPVKSYSSGMLLRLGFAIQFQIQPDILIVDEALAVGDALFQRRCFKKLNDLIDQGTTLLFVSHDYEMVKTLTSSAMLLSYGEVAKIGKTDEVLVAYKQMLQEDEMKYYDYVATAVKENSKKKIYGTMQAEILSVDVFNEKGDRETRFEQDEIIRIVVKYRFKEEMSKTCVGIRIRNKENVKIYSWSTLNQDQLRIHDSSNNTFWNIKQTINEIRMVEFSFVCNLGVNTYIIEAEIAKENKIDYSEEEILYWDEEAAVFSVGRGKEFFGGVTNLKMVAKF